METQETAAAAQPDAGQRPLFTNADLRRLLLPLIGEQFLVIAVEIGRASCRERV